MRIIGPPSADQDSVFVMLQNTASVHPRFTAEMFYPLWNAALRYGIDPIGVVAQATKETGAGQFTGKVKPEFCNPCGLKIRYQNLTFPDQPDPQPLLGDKPLAHAMFPNWNVGATAHVQHLRAYAGWPLGDGELVVDPHYVFVVGKHWCENFEDLSGKWAPALDYGQGIVTIARRLQGK